MFCLFICENEPNKVSAKTISTQMLTALYQHNIFASLYFSNSSLLFLKFITWSSVLNSLKSLLKNNAWHWSWHWFFIHFGDVKNAMVLRYQCDLFWNRHLTESFSVYSGKKVVATFLYLGFLSQTLKIYKTA